MPQLNGTRGRGGTQHIEEKSAGSVAHIVFPGRLALMSGRKIRNCLFSDPGRGERKTVNRMAGITPDYEPGHINIKKEIIRRDYSQNRIKNDTGMRLSRE